MRAALVSIAALVALMATSPLPAASWRGGGNGTGPELFGAGVLSVGRVYRGSFAADGNTFYFFKALDERNQRYRIYVSRRDGPRWSQPETLDLGGDHSDLYPAIARDGRRLVFSSFRPAPGDTSTKPNAHLWYVDRQGDGWGPPVFMAAANRLGHYHSWVELGSDGVLYFRRTTPDWKVTEGLVSRWNGREYAASATYEAAARWRRWRDDVTVAGASPGPSEDVVLLDVATRNTTTGTRGSDIWVSLRQGGVWSDPKPLGAGINSEGYDVFPFFSPDGRTLYFVRDFSSFYSISLQDALASVR